MADKDRDRWPQPVGRPCGFRWGWQASNLDPGLELVGAGVTLRMTDPLWCLWLDLSARGCWLDAGA
jgi:hypothetical protein